MSTRFEFHTPTRGNRGAFRGPTGAFPGAQGAARRLRPWRPLILALLAATLAGSGCSVRRLAVNKAADALTGGGTTFTSDEDPELVRDALPFSLKLMESLLAETPAHRGLLTTLGSGFAQYTYAFVQMDADELEAKDYPAAELLRARARRLYLRARGYGLRGLEAAHPGFTNALPADPVRATAGLNKTDVPLVYWTAASWAAAIVLSKDDPARLAEIPQMEALIDRAFALDPDWGLGAIHSFLVAYEMSRTGIPGDPAERSRRHFDRAVELCGGQLAGPFVGYAESVCVEKQDAKQFDALLRRALAVDVQARPEWRLENLVMQRRARWLLSRSEDLFLVPVSQAQP
jgi:predicted anti-sigma-YlaC factor YlaD